jgi:hypothetical protein
LRAFLGDQREALLGFVDNREAAARGDVLMLSSHDRKRSTMKDTLATLRTYAA